MTSRSSRLLTLLVAVGIAALLAACGDDGSADGPSDIEVTDVAIVLPAGANSAIYFTVANAGPGDDTLTAASTPVGDTALHETRLEDGLMTMHHVDSVPVGAGETVSFQPGGLHVMVHDVEPLAEGDTVPVELVFEKAGLVEVEATVRTSDALIEG